MVCFQTKNRNLSKLCRVLHWKMLVYCMAILSILRPFNIFSIMYPEESGTMVRCYYFKIFLQKIGIFTASFGKSWIITLEFKKNAFLLAENCQKSQKIVIIASTPGRYIVRTKIVVRKKSSYKWALDRMS
jgi:hypothetical protein